MAHDDGVADAVVVKVVDTVGDGVPDDILEPDTLPDIELVAVADTEGKADEVGALL